MQVRTYDRRFRIYLQREFHGPAMRPPQRFGRVALVYGDSYWYGDYVACKPYEGVSIRIVDYPTPVEGEYKYDADVRLHSECKTPMTVIDDAFRKVLAQIEAHDVQEIEPFD